MICAADNSSSPIASSNLPNDESTASWASLSVDPTTDVASKPEV